MVWVFVWETTACNTVSTAEGTFLPVLWVVCVRTLIDVVFAQPSVVSCVNTHSDFPYDNCQQLAERDDPWGSNATTGRGARDDFALNLLALLLLAELLP